MRLFQTAFVAFAACVLLLEQNILNVDAVPANPNPYTDVQPDGTNVVLRMKGDEWNHREEDLEGFTVVRVHPSTLFPGNNNGNAVDSSKKRPKIVYAGGVDANGELVPTTYEVGKANPNSLGIPKGLRGKDKGPADSSEDFFPTSPLVRRRGASRRAASKGTVKNLVVLVRFRDHLTRPLPTPGDIHKLCNNPTQDVDFAPTGSLKYLWQMNSYGSLSIESVVTDWIDVSFTEIEAANRDSGTTTFIWTVLKDALTKADARIDFKSFDTDNNGQGDTFIDMITFIHSGYGAETTGGPDMYLTQQINRIWSHKWQFSIPWVSQEGVKVQTYHISPALRSFEGSSINSVGVVAHEAGHFMGLPDLYDIDYSGNGLGAWCLMANSWGFDGTGYYPPHLSAWGKVVMGYVIPTDITESGEYTILPQQTNPQMHRIRVGFGSQEYLLIENRQAIGYDRVMPLGASGLAIYHIDDSLSFSQQTAYTQSWPGQPSWPAHYRVALKQADGLFELERGTSRGNRGDTYKLGGIAELGPNTTPSTHAYQGNVLRSTGIKITVLTQSQTQMRFRVDIPGSPVACGSTAAAVTCPLNFVLKSTTQCVTYNTCNVATCCTPSPVCSAPGSLDGATCDDGNLATSNDMCKGGVCQGSPRTCETAGVTCPQFFSRLDSTVCGADCTLATCCASICANPSLEGAQCSDNNTMTVKDRCQAGSCIGDQATCGNTMPIAPGETIAKCSEGTLQSTLACVPGDTCNPVVCCKFGAINATVQPLAWVLLNGVFRYRANIRAFDLESTAVPPSPIAGATVTGYFIGTDWQNIVSARTDASGAVVFLSTNSWTNTRRRSTAVQFVVTSITGVPGWRFQRTSRVVSRCCA